MALKESSVAGFISFYNFLELINKMGETFAQRLTMCVYLCLSGLSMGKSVYEQQRHRNLEENWGPGARRDQTKTSWNGSHQLVAHVVRKHKRNKTMRTKVYSWSGIGDVQHCIVLIRGQDEKIPIVAAVVGIDIGLLSFSCWFCVFDFLLVF